MDAVTRARILALIRHLRTRRRAGLEISSADLATRFRLDAFVVDRLIEQELGRAGDGVDPSTDPAEPHRPTREMSPPVGSGLD